MFWEFDCVCEFNEGFAAVKKYGRWGYINTKCEQIIECKFDDVGYFTKALLLLKKMANVDI